MVLWLWAWGFTLFIKNFSETEEAERIDAEYFQPKYEEIIEAVKKYKGGFGELGELVKIKDKNFTPKDGEQYKYIELVPTFHQTAR